jgi:hypothetical protein
LLSYFFSFRSFFPLSSILFFLSPLCIYFYYLSSLFLFRSFICSFIISSALLSLRLFVHLIRLSLFISTFNLCVIFSSFFQHSSFCFVFTFVLSYFLSSVLPRIHYSFLIFSLFPSIQPVLISFSVSSISSAAPFSVAVFLIQTPCT